jgi:alpha-D-ribose 1-methylphosphonate 5-triphosphate synthase subunit PhnG
MTPARPDWLRTLALADADALAARADAVIADYAFETLRAAEAGLVLVRARIAGDGERFNLGEATAARCVVRHRAPQGAFAGVGYVLGRDLARAERIAKLDALLQRDDLRPVLASTLLQPLADAIAQRRAARAGAAAATRVRFFTLASEATP